MSEKDSWGGRLSGRPSEVNSRTRRDVFYGASDHSFSTAFHKKKLTSCDAQPLLRILERASSLHARLLPEPVRHRHSPERLSDRREVLSVEYFSDKSLQLNILRETWPIPLGKFLRMYILGEQEKKISRDPSGQIPPSQAKPEPSTTEFPLDASNRI